LEQSREPIP